MSHKTRRQFIKTAAAIPLAVKQMSNQARKITFKNEVINADAEVRMAAIGMGIMGFNNCQTAVKIPGVKMVAACDLYSGRLT